MLPVPKAAEALSTLLPALPAQMEGLYWRRACAAPVGVSVARPRVTLWISSFTSPSAWVILNPPPRPRVIAASRGACVWRSAGGAEGAPRDGGGENPSRGTDNGATRGDCAGPCWTAPKTPAPATCSPGTVCGVTLAVWPGRIKATWPERKSATWTWPRRTRTCALPSDTVTEKRVPLTTAAR